MCKVNAAAAAAAAPAAAAAAEAHFLTECRAAAAAAAVSPLSEQTLRVAISRRRENRVKLPPCDSPAKILLGAKSPSLLIRILTSSPPDKWMASTTMQDGKNGGEISDFTSVHKGCV